MPARSRTRRVTELLLALLAGAVAGLLGGCAQQQVVGAARLPVGLVLGVGLTVALTVLVRAWASTPWVVLPLSAGWFGVVLLLASPRPEGDVLVPADRRGWSFLLLGTAVLTVALVQPSLRRAAAR